MVATSFPLSGDDYAARKSTLKRTFSVFCRSALFRFNVHSSPDQRVWWRLWVTCGRLWVPNKGKTRRKAHAASRTYNKCDFTGLLAASARHGRYLLGFWSVSRSVHFGRFMNNSITENCHAPANISGYRIVNQIRSVAQRYGPVNLFKAYFDFTQSSSAKSMILRSELQTSGVSLTDCPHNGKKDVADNMILGM